ncbi:MAG: hypothetical protein JHC33_06740, partial [Ignisphaera sp.]|nr:hypothetical protein [Ignisphaera sp.]
MTHTTTGYSQVYWFDQEKAFKARVVLNGKSIYLGCYTHLSDAHKAVQDYLVDNATPRLLEDLGMQLPTSTSKRYSRYGIYECPHCNSHFRARSNNVTYGTTRSCGCLTVSKLKERITKHGLCSSPIYSVWLGIIYNTTNTKSRVYEDYKRRGISVSDEWMSPTRFIADMEQ